VNRRAVEHDAAPFDWHVARDRVEQRRLPGAVRADQRPDLAAARGQVHVLQRLQACKAHADLGKLEQSGHQLSRK
jgi:hypothetical protein